MDNILEIVKYSKALQVNYTIYSLIFIKDSFFKLYKALTPNMLKVIKPPKVLDKNKYQEITLNQLNKQYEQDVLTFINTLEGKLSKDQLLYMYKNLKK